MAISGSRLTPLQILNMLSTGSQIRIGKTYGNMVSPARGLRIHELTHAKQMVDLKMSNEKLRDRARRVVRSIVPAGSVLDVTDDEVLDRVLASCDGQVKLSILVATTGCSVKEGRLRLELSSGSLRKAMEAH